MIIPKSYSYGGPCSGFESNSECYKVLGLVHEVKLNGGLCRGPSSKVVFIGYTTAEDILLFHL